MCGGVHDVAVCCVYFDFLHCVGCADRDGVVVE